MKLVVVESPAKVKTIKKFLGKGYDVVASMGHVVDLPKKELGVNEKKDFEPDYIVTNEKALKRLKDSFKDAKTLVIATDLDREGEAIGWHIARQLGVITKRGRSSMKTKSVERIVFASITKEDVLKAIENPRDIDLQLVDAQQARRILDRLFGYKLSPLLWKKIRYGLSAGRVQSVALRLIVDREEERDKFDPKEYWSVGGDVSAKKGEKKVKEIILENSKDSKKKNNKDKKYEYKKIAFDLKKIDDKDPKLKKKKDAKKVLSSVGGKDWIISDVEKRKSSRNPRTPFITSTLQQTCANVFGYSSKKTMRVAQKLYEAGHITYMRTDSLNIVNSQIKSIRKFIKTDLGDDYLSKKERKYKSKSKAAQEAHEAIRPTKANKSSSDIKLKGDPKKLYDLIRNRTLATQMAPARIENVNIKVKVGKCLFQANGQRILFDGYLKLYPEKVSENILPKVKKGQQLYPLALVAKQHFTSPPPRYSEATLIKALEKHGIGRPSTYAPIISTILARKYVLKDGRYFVPTPTGKVVTKLLKDNFPNVVDTKFTAKIEDELDKVAQGKRKWVPVIKDFYKPFKKKIKEGEKKIKRDKYTVVGKSRYKCPECGGKMVKKIGKYGVFLSCKKFPKCKGMRSKEGKTKEDRKKEVQKTAKSDDFKDKYLPAPTASDGKKMILKIGRYGKFWAHPDYPKVKESSPLLLKKKCPKCGEPLVERKSKWGKPFIGCSGFPRCRYIKKEKKKKKKG